MRRLIIGLFIIVQCALFPVASMAAPNQNVGAQADATVPDVIIPPCTTFGFTEEAQLTLPTGWNNGVLIRVDQSEGANVGFVFTEDSASQRIAVFNLTTMTLVSSAITDAVTPGKYRRTQRIQGDIDTAEGKLYVFREARNGGGSCSGGAGFNCISFARFNANSVQEVEAITSADATVNIDDARQNGPDHFTIINGEVTPTNGNRRLELFSKSSLLKLSNGSEFGLSNFGHLSRTFNSNIYGMVASATGNGFRIPSGTATQNGTFSMTASFGTRLIAALYGLRGDQATPVQQIVGESDLTGGAAGFRAYVNQSDLVNCCTGSYVATNGAAIFQGTFYDTTNNKVFSGRADGAAEEIIRTTPGPNTFTVEETLNCVNCSYNPGSNTGSQVIDYAPHKARLFTVSNGSPAVINRIGVCASGGPGP